VLSASSVPQPPGRRDILNLRTRPICSLCSSVSLRLCGEIESGEERDEGALLPGETLLCALCLLRAPTPGKTRHPQPTHASHFLFVFLCVSASLRLCGEIMFSRRCRGRRRKRETLISSVLSASSVPQPPGRRDILNLRTRPIFSLCSSVSLRLCGEIIFSRRRRGRRRKRGVCAGSNRRGRNAASSRHAPTAD
jgi:hypothetical protein